MGTDGHDPPSSDEKPVSSPRYLLPNDLPAALKHLNDGELDELEATVNAEQRNRGKKPLAPASTADKPRQTPSATLTVGKLNAVRASLEAGVTPAKIAKEFGISQAEVRNAMVTFAEKKRP